MLKTIRLALILGLMMGSFMATPVMAAPPKTKKAEKKQDLKISSFDEYLKLLVKGKDKWTPQELKDLREYAFERERQGYKIAIPIVQKYIAEKVPRALELFSEELMTPGTMSRKEKIEKRDVIGKEMVKKGGYWEQEEREAVYKADAIFGEEMRLYWVPKDLLTPIEQKKRRLTEDSPNLIPTQSAQMNRVGYLFTSRDKPKTNSD